MEEQGLAPRRRGRPPQAGEGKRAFFNTRLRAAVKTALEWSAMEDGRSLSEEIERRLERSLGLDMEIKRDFGDFRVQAVYRSLTDIAQTASNQRGDWIIDPQIRGVIFRQWKRHLDWLHSSMSQLTLYDELIAQVRRAASKDLDFAKKLALSHCGTFISSTPETVREEYYKAVEEITGLTSTDLDGAIAAAGAAEYQHYAATTAKQGRAQ